MRAGAHPFCCQCFACYNEKRKAGAGKAGAGKAGAGGAGARVGDGWANAGVRGARAKEESPSNDESFATVRALCRRRASAALGPTRRGHCAQVGETLHAVESAGDVARLARLVEADRSSRGHDLNERSSRSHCLVSPHLL
jgi:hypothetical protein